MSAAASEAPPRLVYDDDCGFCTRAARHVARRGVVELVGFSELGPDQRARLPPDWEECAHLLTDDAVYSCGEAMVRAYELTGTRPARLVPLARRLPGYAWLRDGVYGFVAAHRDWFGRHV
ncbi:MAG: thiol-disulfide oxidoreductase DCC family protein [Halobacteriaceae archaeon]